MFKLGIKNFRGFLDNEFAFSRVNILIGENSAGKSSLLKFLLALKQSLQVPNSRDYNLTLAGEEVDLGNYEEVIYNHEVDRNLSFSFEFGKEYFDFFKKNISLGERVITEIDIPITIFFEMNQDLSNHKNIRTKIINKNIGELEIVFNQNQENPYSLNGNKPTCNIHFNSYLFNKSIILEGIEYGKMGFLTGIYLDKMNAKLIDEIRYGELEPKQKTEIFIQMEYLQMFEAYLQVLFLNLEYLNNPDFEAAKRLYFKRDKKMNENINNIGELIHLLGGDGFLQEKALADFTKEYITKLTEFGIVDNIYIKKNDSIRELRVIVNGIDSNITDVGFGVSLQLPIIAQAILTNSRTLNSKNRVLKKGGIILIEQPEIHLHPSLQAKFMDSLLQIGDNNMYFIETHSEHIVRKLQVLVKEGKYGLKPEDVCIHYFRKENGHIVTTLHTIDQATGKLSPKFPSGFYDVSTNLAYELIS